MRIWHRVMTRLAARGRRLLFGRDIRDVDEANRLATFRSVLFYVTLEKVPGDVLEFGVCKGYGLLMLSHAYQPCRPYDDQPRTIAGFDSFEGLEADHEGHGRFHEGLCKEPGANRSDVLRLFAQFDLPAPEIHVGPFAQTLPGLIGHRYTRAAVVHIDCDLYEATSVVLAHVGPILQDGTVVLFDDWFCYRGNPHKGQSRAFAEFLAREPGWQAIPYATYGVTAKAFIMHRTSPAPG